MEKIFIRKPNIFEKLIFIIGILIIIMGYVFIHSLIVLEGSLTWDALQTIFLWLLIIGVIILASVNENMKEELKSIILNQHQELKILRQDLKYKKWKKDKCTGLSLPGL